MKPKAKLHRRTMRMLERSLEERRAKLTKLVHSALTQGR